MAERRPNMKEIIKPLSSLLGTFVVFIAVILGLGFLFEDYPWIFGTSMVILYVALVRLEKYLKERGL